MESLTVGNVRRTQPWPTKTLQPVPTILVEEVQESSRTDAVVPTIHHKEIYSDPERKEAAGKNLSLKNLVPDIFMRRASEKRVPETIIQGHQLVNHNFKKATFCDVCHRLLVGIDFVEREDSSSAVVAGFQRHGLRCKICKANLHANCAGQVEECQGVPLGSFSFSRQLSPSGQGPDQSCFHSGSRFLRRRTSKNKVDTVYQVLREGIILRTCKDSTNGSDSLQRTSSAESNPSPGASDAKPGSRTSSPLLTQRNDQPQPETSGASPLHRTEKGRSSPAQDTQEARADEQASSNKRTNNRCVSPGENAVGEPPTETRGQLKMQQMERLAEEGNLYVALYKFEAQQRDDLSLRPGDRINVTNDKDESWWIGECENRHGFFPANFVMGVRPTEQICNCTQPTTLKDTGNKEIPLKRNQVLAIRLDWPVSDPSYVYARSPSAEGYVRKEDLKPL